MLPALPDLTHRQRQPELMDQPGLDVQDHQQALRGLRRVNVVSRSAEIVWPHLAAFARAQQGRTVRVLDVASGGGDVLGALARKARATGLPMELHGCDVSPVAVEFATCAAARAGLDVRYFECDVLTDGLPGDYDAVICSLFLHHLDRPEAVALLSHMRSAARLVLVCDLRRSRLGYVLAWSGARLLSRSRVVHVDGPLSVRGAWTIAEARELADEAGLAGARFTRHWPQRFLLHGRRE